MASNLLDLPDEVLDRIFSFHSNEKFVIGSCRLVCHRFRQLSSPYLITCLIYARRLRTIAHFNEVIEHDYFRHHVIELFYDASSYQGDEDLNWHTYVYECRNAEQELSSTLWEQRKLEDRLTWGNIYGALASQSRALYGQTFPNNKINNNSGIDVEGDEDNMDDGYLSNDHYDNLADPFDDDALTLGCHESFPDYLSNWNAERRIDREGTTSLVLARGFCRLRRLSSIVFSDWRSLARWNESYSDCARRLFANTLAPRTLSMQPDRHRMLFRELVISIKQSNHAAIRHLAIGSHMFEDESNAINMKDSRAPIFTSLGSFIDMSNVITKLQRLCLRLHIQTNFLDASRGLQYGYLQRVLSQASNLEQLVLAIPLPHQTEAILRSYDQGKPGGFKVWLADHHYPRLRSLSLQGWILPERLLENFLFKHASTLQALHLKDCHLVGDQLSLAQWAGVNLSLHGIEISQIPETDKFYGQKSSRDTESQLLPSTTSMSSEFESTWLAGRPNFTHRRSGYNPLRDDDSPLKVHWWNKRRAAYLGPWTA